MSNPTRNAAVPNSSVVSDCNAPLRSQPTVEEQRRPSPDNNLLISVVVPVRNEEVFIEGTLRALLDQDYPADRFEIIVADGQSTDATCEIVHSLMKSHRNLRLVDNHRRLSSAGRNAGIRAATGDVVLIIDGHCEIPTRRLLTNVAEAFDESGADCLGRPQPLNMKESTTLQKAIAAARSSRLGHHPESFIYSDEPQFVPAKSVAVAYRREVFDQTGYFDEAFDAHEDGELNYRVDQAGLTCYFTPKISVKYCPRGNLRGLYRQMVRYGRGRVRFSRKHLDTWDPSTLFPALFVLYVLIGGILALAFPALAIPYVGGLGIYAAVAAIFSIAIAIQERRLSVLFWLPLVFLAVHTGAGVGILAEAIAPKKVAGTFRVPSAK